MGRGSRGRKQASRRKGGGTQQRAKRPGSSSASPAAAVARDGGSATGVVACAAPAAETAAARPAQGRRGEALAVPLIGGAMVFWLVALVLLWRGQLGPGASAGALAVVAVLLSAATALQLPGALAGAVESLVVRLGWQDPRLMELSSVEIDRGTPEQMRSLVRLLAVGAASAVAGLVASTMLLGPLSRLLDWMAGSVSWTSGAWWLVRLVVIWTGMLPAVAGLSVLVVSGSMLRGGSGPDAGAKVLRDWVGAMAVGLAAAAVAWWMGWHLVGLMGAAAVLTAGATAWVVRSGAFGQPRGPLVRPVERPSARLGLAVAGGLAGVAMLWAVQARMLVDVAGASLGTRLAWLAGSAALLAFFLRRAERLHRAFRPAETGGALLGAAAGAGLQMAVASLAVGAAPWRAVLCAIGPIAAQVALMALISFVLTAQRRRYAVAGGSSRSYLGWALAGGAVGTLLPGALLGLAWGGLWVLSVGLGVLSVAVLAGLVGRAPASWRRGWVALGLVMLWTVLTGVVAGLRHVNGQVGPVRSGAWLTVRHATEGSAPAVLPMAAAATVSGIDEVQERLLGDHRGRWWVVVDHPGRVESLPVWVQATVACLDIRAGGTRLDARGALPEDFALQAHVGRTGRFDGVLIAALRADHPEAWQVLNVDVLGRCARRLAPQGGVLAVRTQVAPDAIGRALATAGAFREVVGTGTAAIAAGPEGVDMLLIGPARRTGGADLPGVHVVDLEALEARWGAATYDLNRPGRQGPSGVSLPDFIAWLADVGS